MKKNHILLLLTVGTAMLAGCDKGFEKMNINPQAVTDVDPGTLFTTALRANPTGGMESDFIVSQQFWNPYTQSTTLGFNGNSFHEGQNSTRWNNAYTGPVKHLEQVISVTKNDATRSNLYNEARIWRAYYYMYLVDTYGDVPYSQAGKGFLEALFYPKYDSDEEIYTSLRNELKEASAALDPSKNNEAKYDLYFQGDIAKWKRLGYSLLLRLGMRYSKVNENLAKTIVQEAFTGGVMQSNADNVYLTHNPSNTNPFTGIRATNSDYFYFAQPFISRLKAMNDPRLKFIAGKYFSAAGAHADIPDTTTAAQAGFPIGFDNNNPGSAPNPNGGFNYSQVNFYVLGNATAPVYIITNAQTKFLLAEAAFRGWLTGGQTAQQYYEAGIRAALDEWSLYPNGFGSGNVSIPTGVQDAYLANPNVAYSAANALNLINTQYWIESFSNRSEAWFNHRRTGFPTLTPNPYGGGLGGDGFVHRFIYPLGEQGANKANYDAAVAAMGGDTWLSRVFWDN